MILNYSKFLFIIFMNDLKINFKNYILIMFLNVIRVNRYINKNHLLVISNNINL